MTKKLNWTEKIEDVLLIVHPLFTFRPNGLCGCRQRSKKAGRKFQKMSSHIKTQIEKSNKQIKMLVNTMNSMNLSTKESKPKSSRSKASSPLVKMVMEQYLDMFSSNKSDLDIIVQSIH